MAPSKSSVRFSWLALLVVAVTIAPAVAACGSDGGSSNNNTSGDGDGDAGGDGDGDGDAGGDGDGDGGSATCTPGSSQCSDCVDNDGDGDIDGADIHCTSLADNDEASFETGLPGDNKDQKNQDCFFDGDSGDGNDGCNVHICCLLGATSAQECSDFGDQFGFTENNFNPNTDCTVSQQCIDVCQPSTTPGCDCFGCCTLCNGTECKTVLTDPLVAPDCDKDTLNDPNSCPECTQVTECSNPCDNANCELCPGQTEEDLPPECNGQNECDNNYTPCDTTDDCAVGEFCTAGCCIPQID